MVTTDRIMTPMGRTIMTPPVPDEIREQTIFERVPVGLMFVDRYGRPVNPGRLRRLRADFDPRAIGTVYLSLRDDGRYALLDGQHRRIVAVERGLETLPSRVFIDLTYEQEAALYRKFADYLPQTPADRFRARLEERDPSALVICSVVESFGLHVGLVRSASPGRINALDALDALYRDSGYEILRDTLAMLRAAFGDDPAGYQGTFLRGMGAFLIRYREDPVYDPRRMATRLARIGPDGLVARILAGNQALNGNRFAKAGQVLLKLYNDGLRTNLLPDWVGHVYGPKARERWDASRRRLDDR